MKSGEVAASGPQVVVPMTRIPLGVQELGEELVLFSFGDFVEPHGANVLSADIRRLAHVGIHNLRAFQLVRRATPSGFGRVVLKLPR